MLAFTFLVTLVVQFVGFCTAGYVLEDDYSVDNFFGMFDFFTDADPTHGYVQYVDQTSAQSNGLINTNNGVFMGVDSKSVASGSGRQSVRLTSKKTYTHGLIILDLSHMPEGCGTWPAFWTVGPNWPNAGEIDIIEGVNSQVGNSMTLHTGPGCSVSNTGLFSGQVSTSNCDVNAAGQPGNAGCAILTSNTASYGTGFNQGQGGVYATEWTSDHISIWFFPRGAIPSDVSGPNPDPSGWGQPTASFASTSCDIDSIFSDHQIVFDTTFCGDWAGNVWSSDAVCGSKASTCQAFVQNNPSAFQNAYWSVNSLQVFQDNGQGGAPSGSASAPSQSSLAPTAGVSAPWPGASSSAAGALTIAPTPETTSQAASVHGGNSASGGNGWRTRAFGTSVGGNAFYDAASVQSTATTAALVATTNAAVIEKVAAPTSTTGPPLAVVVGADGNVSEYNESASPSPVPTSAPAPAPASASSDNKGEDADVATVSAASNQGFSHHRAGHKRDGLFSEAELGIEPRSTPDEAEISTEVVKRHLSMHRRGDAHNHGHGHRHVYRRGYALGEGGSEE